MEANGGKMHKAHGTNAILTIAISCQTQPYISAIGCVAIADNPYQSRLRMFSWG